MNYVLAITFFMETMKVNLLVLCLVSLFTITIQAQTCDNNRYIDGCSVPKGVKIEFKGRFRPACNKHDICYSCRVHFGISRFECDKRFRANMKRICPTINGNNFVDTFIRRQSCKVHADIYYTAVRAGGIISKEKQPGWCRQKWVKSCM